MKAKAMVVLEPGRMEMREYEVVPPADDEILIRTYVTSVCSTDVKVFHGKTPLGRYPLIMGHEFVGEVVEIGKEAAKVYDVKVGEVVTPEPYVPCGHCNWCRTDNHYHNCPDVTLYGINMNCVEPPYLRGGYAEYVYLMPGTILHKLAPGASPLAGSLSSVVGNGVRWVKTLGQMSFGDTLVISGVGSQGLSALAAAKEAGVGPVVMMGLSTDTARFELADAIGADYKVVVDKEDPLTRVPELLGGQPDVVIETSGVPAAIKTGLKLVRNSGRMVLIGMSGGKETSLALDELVWRDVSLITGKGQAGNVGDAMRLINGGKYPLDKINNRHYKLEDLEQAVNDTERPPAGFIKAAIVFN